MVKLKIVSGRLEWELIAVACLLLGACAHKPAPAGPQYPVIPEQSVRLLAAAPKPPFARLGVVTIQDRLEAMSGNSWSQVRTMAAQTGANGVFVRAQKIFWHRDPQTKQRVRIERTVYQLVYIP
ncbi:MAG: hypothetical protein JOZ08_23330 [Verrucomicrobia bacterium]|nr:hypothetical protein [Verrucomicrobiota bacterium]